MNKFLDKIFSIFKSTPKMLPLEKAHCLKENYLSVFDGNKLATIENYPTVVEKLNTLDPHTSVILNKCFLEYCKNNGDSNWRYVLNNLIESSEKENLNDLFADLQESNIDENVIHTLLQGENPLNLKSLEELENIDNIIKEQYSKIQKTDKEKLTFDEEVNILNEKRNLVCLKHFGLSLNKVNSFLDSFTNDETHKKNSELISKFERVVTASDELDLLFEDVTISKDNIDLISETSKVKKEYAKDYNEGLYNVDNSPKDKDNRFKGYDVRQAGTDFNMIIHSLGAFREYEHANTNYFDSWNRSNTEAQGASCSYITDGFIKTAPIHSFCFGFSQFDENSLLSMNNSDFATETRGLVPKPMKNITDFRERFYSPEKLVKGKSSYNEILLDRFQNGERKQPDYIIIFEQNGKIIGDDQKESISMVKKAQNDFKKKNIHLPIVIVDVDKCQEKHAKIINNMIEKYKFSLNSHSLYDIEDKMNENRPSFGESFGENYNDTYDKIEELKNRFSTC